MKNISIVYSKPDHMTGVYRYSLSVMDGLLKKGIPFDSIPIKKIEYSLFGKPIGGFISQKVLSKFIRVQPGIVHSMSPESVIKQTNFVTIHDLIRLKWAHLFPSNKFANDYVHNMTDRASKIPNIIADSYNTKNDLISILNIDPDAISVVYPSISDEFKPIPISPYPDDGKIHLVTLGDFNPRKRVDLLVKFLADNKDCDLYIIGSPGAWKSNQLRYEQMTKATTNIHLVGYQEHISVVGYLSNADLFVMYSMDEGFGLPPLEAMACGVNVLVNDIPIFHETMGDVAFYFNDGNFGQSLQNALTNKRTVSEVTRCARRFSVERQIQGLLGCYERMM